MNKNKEYIEREATINELECLPEQGELDYLGVFDCVKSVPAADVEPVRHGEWICYTIGVSSYCECPVCGENSPSGFKTPYCPNCGTKMDGGKNNDNLS